MNYVIISSTLWSNSQSQEGFLVPHFPTSREEASEFIDVSEGRVPRSYHDFSGRVARFLADGWHILGSPVLEVSNRRIHLALLEDSVFHKAEQYWKADSPENMCLVGRTDPKGSYDLQKSWFREDPTKTSDFLEDRVRFALREGWFPSGGLSSCGRGLRQTMWRNSGS